MMSPRRRLVGDASYASLMSSRHRSRLIPTRPSRSSHPKESLQAHHCLRQPVSHHVRLLHWLFVSLETWLCDSYLCITWVMSVNDLGDVGIWLGCYRFMTWVLSVNDLSDVGIWLGCYRYMTWVLSVNDLGDVGIWLGCYRYTAWVMSAYVTGAVGMWLGCS